MSEVMRELPRYQSIKKVHALKISHIMPSPRGYLIGFFDQKYAPHEVDAKWLLKHAPHRGGYLVVYDDGYQSFSPAEAFEAGNIPLSSAPTLEQLNSMIDAVVGAAHRYACEQDIGPARIDAFNLYENLHDARRRV